MLAFGHGIVLVKVFAVLRRIKGKGLVLKNA